MRMSRALALVAAALGVCILVLLAVVFLTRDEDNLQADNLLAERFTKQVRLAADPQEGLNGRVDLRILAPFSWDHVLYVADGTPRAAISKRLGRKWTGIDGVDGGDLLLFLRDGHVVRFADYRGNGSFEGFARPFDEIPRSRAVFHVQDQVIRP
jgi:hypothetical protein